MCTLARHVILCLVMVQPRKTGNCLDMTEKKLPGSTWRSGVRSAMRAASQLPGKGPTDVDDAPAPSS